MDMIVNTNKVKLMIVKSKNIIYDTFIYDNNYLEQVLSLKYFGIEMFNMIVNTKNMKVMIIKSKRIIYDTLIYDKNYLEKVLSVKHLGIEIHHKLS